MAFPWLTLLRQTPMLVSAADALLSSARRNAAVRESADAAALQQRVAALEAQQQQHAELVRQMAEQVNALSLAAQANARRLRLALALAGVAAALGALATLLAIMT